MVLPHISMYLIHVRVHVYVSPPQTGPPVFWQSVCQCLEVAGAGLHRCWENQNTERKECSLCVDSGGGVGALCEGRITVDYCVWFTLVAGFEPLNPVGFWSRKSEVLSRGDHRIHTVIVAELTRQLCLLLDAHSNSVSVYCRTHTTIRGSLPVNVLALTRERCL